MKEGFDLHEHRSRDHDGSAIALASLLPHRSLSPLTPARRSASLAGSLRSGVAFAVVNAPDVFLVSFEHHGSLLAWALVVVVLRNDDVSSVVSGIGGDDGMREKESLMSG